ncbi:hypothetical protein N007_18840 [Alicyclobacillus acidoterrestris ATCC 49025]|nr:hypothetical protein N007_18840 [Alicyclobacillus acidoterrestris ATCC 49025]
MKGVMSAGLVSMTDMLLDARKKKYAVGQFNMNGIHWVQAILQAAEEERAPVILAASDRLIEYLGGFRVVVAFVNALLEEMSITVPVALHLDHGKSVERCIQAIDAGFSSVMIDGSHLPINENIAMTKQVVDYAHLRGVSVEAEVGTVGGMEDGLIGGVKYADPNECLRLVQETGVDALAAALGSVHGPYQGEPRLGFEEMKQISTMVNVPLVLHGASGIPGHQIKKAIEFGHAKINVNTECVQAWAQAVRNVLSRDHDVYDPRTILTPGRDAITAVVQEKIREFNANGKV